MARIDLTDFKVKSLKPKTRVNKATNEREVLPADFYDDRVRGLVIRVSAEGTLTWRVMWYLPDGRSRFTKIGRYPVMSIVQARDAALTFLRDPQKALARELPHIFQDVAEEYIQKHVKDGGLLTARTVEQRIRKHLIPAFMNQEFALVRRAHLIKQLDTDHKGKPAMRDAILSIFRSMAHFYMLNLDPTETYVNPIIRGMKQYEAKSRDRVLTDEEIVVLWKVTETMGTFGALCRFLLLTGQRREKGNKLRHDDIRSGIWHLPVIDDRSKGHPAEIKLAPLALQIVNSQPKVYKCPYVFPALRGKGAFNAWGQFTTPLQAEMRKHLPHMRDFTTHDLRRSARTLIDRLSPPIPFEVKEAAIGHSVGSKVSRTYSRYDYLPEISEAYAALDAHITRLIHPAPSNVVRLKRGRQR